MFVKVVPAIDYSVRALCKRPYPGRPDGCLNYGTRKTCPPAAPFFEQVVDLGQPVYAIVNEFDLGGFAAAMLEKHPDWTGRKCHCSRYWQGTARKQLRLQVADFLRGHPGYMDYLVPEAMGVNVFETLRRVGIDLEWPVQNVDRHVALVGWPKKPVLVQMTIDALT